MSRSSVWNGNNGTVTGDLTDEKNFDPTNIREPGLQWTLSVAQAGEYWAELNGGGDPLFNEPDLLQEKIAGVLTNMTKATVGSLAVSG